MMNLISRFFRWLFAGSMLQVVPESVPEGQPFKASTVVKAQSAVPFQQLLTPAIFSDFQRWDHYGVSGSLYALLEQVLVNQMQAKSDQKRFLVLLEEILAGQSKVEPATTITILEEEIQMGFTIGADDTAKGFKLSITDKHGNPASVDGVPVWSTSDPSLLTLSPSTDGMHCTVVATGPVGTAQLVVSADADVGAGVTEITGTTDITVVAGEAAEIGIVPEDQPPV